MIKRLIGTKKKTIIHLVIIRMRPPPQIILALHLESYYVNHVRRTTQWQRPIHPASVTTLQRSHASNRSNSTTNNSISSNQNNLNFGGLNAPRAKNLPLTTNNGNNSSTVSSPDSVPP